MNRIDEKFKKLRADGRTAFMPYVTAGDPDAEATAEIILALEKSGADLIELGIPYSDPLADGPTIQSAFTRVLARGFRVSDAFEIVQRVRERSDIPIAVMVSYSIVYRYGCERFVEDALAAGADGAIIPDLCVSDGAPLLDFSASKDFATILLVAPTTEAGREREIVERTTGFLYCVSVVGITGERDSLPPELGAHVERLRTMTDKPICVGFGVSRPEHVRTVAEVADGVIVGSAIVKKVAENANDREKLLETLSDFAVELTAPLR